MFVLNHMSKVVQMSEYYQTAVVAAPGQKIPKTSKRNGGYCIDMDYCSTCIIEIIRS